MKMVQQRMTERKMKRLRRIAESQEFHYGRAYETGMEYGRLCAESEIMGAPAGIERKKERYLKKMRRHAKEYREVM